MPDLATMQAARPKCPAVVQVVGVPVAELTRCDEPMRWSADVEAWVCPLHGRIEKGESVYQAALRDA